MVQLRWRCRLSTELHCFVFGAFQKLEDSVKSFLRYNIDFGNNLFPHEDTPDNFSSLKRPDIGNFVILTGTYFSRGDLAQDSKTGEKWNSV